MPLLKLIISSLVVALSLSASNAPRLAQNNAQSGLETSIATQANATVGSIPATQRSLTQDDANAWLDGLVPFALQQGDIAGAVVVVVKDGNVLTQRGYGLSDVTRRTPMDPKKTLVRVGSISKLFTWTAVMQLVELGKIDLDADVNHYLDFRIPPFRGKPVTMRNLMTHTAGFEERFQGLEVVGRRAVPLKERVEMSLPARVFDPGSTPAYSNYGAVLAGYIVERVSGVPFEDYVNRNIFNRIGMDQSTFAQPLPQSLWKLASKGYSLASDEPKSYEIINDAPAGALATTGADMGKFMLASLSGSGPLLDQATTRLMHNTRLTVIPPLNRMALGFYEQQIYGHLALAHGGDTQWFHSYVWLFPDKNVGVFISLNSTGRIGAAGNLINGLVGSFVERYFDPASTVPLSRLKNPIADAAIVTGNYSNSRAGHTTFTHIVDLFGQLTVSSDSSGVLSVAGLNKPNGVPVQWAEIAPFVWQDTTGYNRIAARVVNGRAVAIATDESSPFQLFIRTPWYSSATWLLPCLLISLMVCGIIATAWPFEYFVRRHYQIAVKHNKRRIISRRMVRIFAVASLALALCWLVALYMVADFSLHDALVPVLPILEIASMIGFIGFVVASGYHLILGWRESTGFFAIARAVLLFCSAFTLLWTAGVFNLLSINSNF